jgi:hypothetical protein
MADMKDSEIKAAADAAPANEGPLLIEGPKATADSTIIDLEPIRTAGAEESAAQEETAAPNRASRWHLPAAAPLAAAITFAVALGAIAGAAATSGLLRETAPPTATADATQALQTSVAQLGSELAALKTTIASAQKSSSTQLGKLTERLDRSDKTQAEPTAKLAKIQESIDRLEHRQQHAGAPASDITGSVAPPKEDAKPQVLEGWRLRDFYDGRAVVENRSGMLFKVGPGSNVPGLGKVEAIKRENGKVVVVTANGIIASALDPRRPAYYYRW